MYVFQISKPHLNYCYRRRSYGVVGPRSGTETNNYYHNYYHYYYFLIVIIIIIIIIITIIIIIIITIILVILILGLDSRLYPAARAALPVVMAVCIVYRYSYRYFYSHGCMYSV